MWWTRTLHRRAPKFASNFGSQPPSVTVHEKPYPHHPVCDTVCVTNQYDTYETLIRFSMFCSQPPCSWVPCMWHDFVKKKTHHPTCDIVYVKNQKAIHKSPPRFSASNHPVRQYPVRDYCVRKSHTCALPSNCLNKWPKNRPSSTQVSSDKQKDKNGKNCSFMCCSCVNCQFCLGFVCTKLTKLLQEYSRLIL